MPQFKTTYNILTRPWEDEFFDNSFMDSDSIKLPPMLHWDYQRELKIEDIDLWEVLYQASGGVGVYAAWMPYAEFYMITKGWDKYGEIDIETHYGAGSQKEVKRRAKELNMPLSSSEVWVDDKDMWLYEGIKYSKRTIVT